jgi:hypothetical protein
MSDSMRFRLLVAIVLAIALTATACSSDSDDTTTAGGTDETTTRVDAETDQQKTAIEAGAAAPNQVQNDQGSRATIEFAGNAQALVAGGAHVVDIEMEIEEDPDAPAVTVELTSTDGEITTTGVTAEGDTFTPTWAWTPDGSKVVITMVGRGVTIPATRPSVAVSVHPTDSSEPIEFVKTADAGSGRPGWSKNR